MKKLFSICTFTLLTTLLTAQIARTIDVPTAGTLTNLLTATEKTTVTELTVNGIIDFRDIKIIRESLPDLTYIDIRNVTVTEYNGFVLNADGIAVDLNADGIINENDKAFYPANSLPNIFNDWKNIKTIKLPASIIKLSNNAFESCSSLSNITLPSSLTEIGDQVFQGCNNLSSIIIPETVTKIGNQVFMGCDNLAQINIPNSVLSIGFLTFGSCSITVENSNPNYSSLNGLLYNKNQTKLIFCPTAKTGSFLIPTTVDSIAIGAFYQCVSLTSINIPSSVSSIGNFAFAECSGLLNIYVSWMTPLTIANNTSIFLNVNKTLCTLHVPKNTKALYMDANEWKDFLNTNELTTGLNTIYDKVKVYSTNSEIIVDGTFEGEVVSLYTVNGKEIQTMISKGEKINLTVDRNSVYLVKTGKKTFKVIP